MQTRVREILFQLCRDEEGASLVEYILLVVLIGIAAIVGMTFLGKTANNRLNNVTAAIQ
jgi:Flp pilus assembly pilin Flp